VNKSINIAPIPPIKLASILKITNDSQIVVSPQDNLLLRIDKALRLLHEARHLLEEK
jgi:hypothetical protein